MQKIWQQPFPSPQNSKNSLRMSLIAGVCVFVVLYFFKPFGINAITGSSLFILSIEFAVVTIVCSLLCNTGIPYLFPKFFDEVCWTVLHEIVFLIFLILVVAMGNILVTAVQSNSGISGGLIFSMFKYTIAIGIIPVVISVLVKQQQLLQKYTKGAIEIETLLTSKKSIEAPITILEKQVVGENELSETEVLVEKLPTTILQLSGSNLQEALAITDEDFLFAEASDNYTAIHYLQNNILQKVLYRVTIKNLEAQTSTATSIFRCHKSYLVNLNQVKSISGNAQGYKLHLLQNKFELPVSRSLNSRIKEEFAALRAKN